MCSYCVGIGTIKQQLFENILFSFGNGNLSRGLIFLYTQNTPRNAPLWSIICVAILNRLTLLEMLGFAPLASSRLTKERLLILQANMSAVSPYYGMEKPWIPRYNNYYYYTD